jgi:hypothetical protein
VAVLPRPFELDVLGQLQADIDREGRSAASTRSVTKASRVRPAKHWQAASPRFTCSRVQLYCTPRALVR